MSPVLEAQAVQPHLDRLDAQPGRILAPMLWRPRSAESSHPYQVRSEVTRRVANLAAATILFVLTLPLMIVIAALVRLTSPGPVIYVQTRVGIDRRRGGDGGAVGAERRRFDYGGKLFQIYKFRTMTWNEKEAVQLWAKRNDPRVTPLGSVLRKYRLDELPQLINVLKGEMNLVGPRPEQPRLFAELRNEIAGYAERQRVLPGITGWAQVNHGYDTSVEDVKKKLGYDLEYISQASVVEDLLILMRTIPVIVLQKGAV